MATATKVFTRKAFSLTSETLYTVPAIDVTSIVTNIVVTNTTASPQTFFIDLDGVELFNSSTIPAKSTVSIDMKQVLNGDELITGYASATGVKIHISGVEIS